MRRELAALAIVALAACGPKILWSGHTEDREQKIEIIKDGAVSFVVIDGVRRAGYRGIAVPSLVFAGSHIAFAARVGKRWTVAVDGVGGAAYDSIGEIVLSPSGHVAFAVEERGAWHVVHDGKMGPAFDALLAHTLQFAGDHVVYAAKKAEHFHVAIDGTIGPAFDGIKQLVTSGAHVAYAGRRGTDAIVVRDGVPGRPWPRVTKLQLTGARLAYAASEGEGWRVVVDKEPYPAVDKVHAIWIRDDGAHVAWLGSVGTIRTLALDRIPLVAAVNLREETIAFRPSASKSGDVGLAYAEPTEGGEHLVLDGIAGPTFDEIRAPIWNAAGRLAYAARRGATWFIVYDGLEHGHAEWISDPVLADDGTLGYVRRDHRRTSVVVDRTAYAFDMVFEDTLVVTARDKWAIAAGDVKRKSVYIAIGTQRRVPVPSVELYASAVNGDPKDELRRWTQRELAR